VEELCKPGHIISFGPEYIIIIYFVDKVTFEKVLSERVYVRDTLQRTVHITGIAHIIKAFDSVGRVPILHFELDTLHIELIQVDTPSIFVVF